MCKLNVTSHPESRSGSSNVLHSTEKTELSVLRATQHISFTVCSIYKLFLLVCVRKRMDALAGSCAEKLERMAGSSGTHPVVPGAILSEPLQSHAIQALRWWLLCRGIKALSSWRKAQLIDRFVGQVSS